MIKAFARTVDDILMYADPDTIFRIASDIEYWPQILPHYRWIKVLHEDDGLKTVEMAARRGWIPVKWISVQTVDAPNHRVYYRHTGGLTRGMAVEWSLDKEGDAVRVTVVHEMSLTMPVVKSMLGRWITGRFFVHYIAGRTLHSIKQIVEKERVTGCAVQS